MTKITKEQLTIFASIACTRMGLKSNDIVTNGLWKGNGNAEVMATSLRDMFAVLDIEVVEDDK